jgi:MFS family permease
MRNKKRLGSWKPNLFCGMAETTVLSTLLAGLCPSPPLVPPLGVRRSPSRIRRFTRQFFLAGSAVTAAAGGYAALMAGQRVAGIACGFDLVVAPVYIAEIAPAASCGVSHGVEWETGFRAFLAFWAGIDIELKF